MQAQATSRQPENASPDLKDRLTRGLDRLIDQEAILSVMILAVENLYERYAVPEIFAEPLKPEDYGVLNGLGYMLREARRTVSDVGEDIDFAVSKMGGRHAR